jgi:pimeloyl-ACP methyl ester carboxylesterase
MSASTVRRHLASGVALSALLALAACTQPPASVAPANLDVVCDGEGSPTVILVPGMNTPLDTFSLLQHHLADGTRVCSYSRAGLGDSPAWPDDAPDPSAGMMADQLRATLDAKGIEGPYVMLGWSWGGLVTQAFAARHRDRLAGVVLEDATGVEFLEGADIPGTVWVEAGRPIDIETTAGELESLDLGELPLVVLVQGAEPTGEPDTFTAQELEAWNKAQERHAMLSDNSVRVIAVDAGHAIHLDSEALVEKAVEDVVAAVRSGDPLPACDDLEWGPYTGECP